MRLHVRLLLASLLICQTALAQTRVGAGASWPRPIPARIHDGGNLDLFVLMGQALLTSDRLTDLPAERVELLRRVYPAVDVRPLDTPRCTCARGFWTSRRA